MDAVAAIARTSFSLVAVLGLLYLISRWLRRRNGGGAAGAGEFAVLARQSLGAKASVALVKVGDRALVVGISEQGVSLLGETDVATVFPAPAPAEAAEADAVPTGVGATADAHALSPAPAAGERYTRRAGERVEARPATPAAPEPSPTSAQTQNQNQNLSSTISGSALSPATWTKAVDVLRERTTRR